MPDIFIPSKNKTNSPDNHSHIAENCVPGMFSAFIHHPQKFTFSQQEEGEEIILFMRRHFITNLPWIIAAIIALIVPLLLSPISQVLNSPLPSPSFRVSIILISFYYILVLGFALYNFIDWFYNIGLASKKRLMDLDFTNLSHIDLALTQIAEVEDVVYRQQGFFASYFNYGDVVAHTVTGKEDFLFKKVPHPDHVVSIISQYIGDVEK